MKITSEKAYVTANLVDVYAFLSHAKNIALLLPHDKISDFQSDENGCSFRVQGGILIPLVYTNRDSVTHIEMKSGEKAPFPYTLTIHLNDLTQVVEGHIEFHAEISVFMKMMVEKPLNALFNGMTAQLQQHFSTEI